MESKTKGQAGGRALFQRRGREYMAEIGRAGAKKFWQKYKLSPIDIGGWAIVERATNKIVNFIGSNPARRR